MTRRRYLKKELYELNYHYQVFHEKRLRSTLGNSLKGEVPLEGTLRRNLKRRGEETTITMEGEVEGTF